MMSTIDLELLRQGLCLYCEQKNCTPWKHRCKRCQGNGHEAVTCRREKAKLSRGQKKRLRKKMKDAISFSVTQNKS